MPDWVTHILLGLIICELFNIKKKSFVLLGSLLPDIFLKFNIASLFIDMPLKEIKWALIPLHNPIALIIITIIAIYFFSYDKTKAFLLITAGWVFHLIIDLTNRDFYLNQEVLLFPFSWKTFELNWLWSNQYVYALLPVLACYIIILIIKNKTNLKQALFS